MTEIVEPISWLPLGPAQAGDLYELVRATDLADATPYNTSFAEVQAYFDPAYLWRATGARTASGRLVAFGLTRMPSAHGPDVDVLLSGGVHPDFRRHGIGRRLLALQMRTAEQLAQGEAVRARACMHADSGQTDLMNLLRRLGFQDAYSYVQMRRPLDADIAIAEPPAYISIETLAQSLDDEVRRSHNAIFMEMAHQSPMSAEQWAAERAFMDRDWSFVALDKRGDRPRLAGYLISGRYEQDWQHFGYSEGYIEEVAVHDEWRGLNLISALLGTAMNAYRAEGIDYAGMDVTINPEADQRELYERLDFEQTGQTFVLVKPLDLQPTNIRPN
ncbi:MAG: GNAT family N-acetyltransferase [Ancrocorticia sp.]|jgi:ribosomal protein S18 acetylase RimI-like enzyme|nr:GNAT family N-acetyltransferase [Ancrocorticia sp.]MCI2192817.1 GNAT family N-acetyltransferase [Ancrocorticia sp.]MCI2198252.1 GNAT family N-acetyltransferase [Ancrocorticia sp.]